MSDYSVSGLAGLYARLGRRLADAPRPQEVFETLTAVAVEHIPGAEAAGITRYLNGRLETIAATSELVHAVDQVQYTLRSGPCVSVVEGQAGLAVRADDLRHEPRWPEFGARAVEVTGVSSMLSYRLYVEDRADLVTSLNVYSTRVAAFDEWAQTIGLVLATHGALAVSNAWARQHAEDLEKALQSNRDIAVAVGILMATHLINQDALFMVLRIASQHANRKLHDLAMTVIETGDLQLPSPAAARAILAKGIRLDPHATSLAPGTKTLGAGG